MEAKPEVQWRISPEWARDWAERFLGGWNSHDPGQLLSLATDDVTWVDPFIPGGVAEGKAAVSKWLVSAWSAFPDLAFEMVGEPFVSIDGGRLALAWKGRQPSLAALSQLESSPRAAGSRSPESTCTTSRRVSFAGS